MHIKDTNFIEIEKKISINNIKNYNNLQLDLEFNYYGQAYLNNIELFNKIVDSLVLEINKKKNTFKLEYKYIDKIIEINTINLNIIKENVCPKKLTTQMLVNWVLLGFYNKIDQNKINSNDYSYSSRYDLIENFIRLLTYFIISNDISFNDNTDFQREVKFLATQLLSFISVNGFLKKCTIWNFGSGKIKTSILYGLNLNCKEIKYNLNIYFIEPILKKNKINTYFMGYHYSTMSVVFKKNIKSNKFFELNDHSVLNKLKTLKYYIDTDVYNLIVKEILNEFKCGKEELKKTIIKKIDYILKNETISKKFLNKKYFLDICKKNMDTNKFTYEENGMYDNYLDNLLLEIIDIPDIKDDNFYYNYKNYIEKGDDVDLKNNVINHYILTTFEENKNILNKYYNYLLFLSLEELFKNQNYFYLSYSFDFRGRLYSNSVISPIGNKIFRYIYNYGFYDNLSITNLSFKIDNKIENIIKESNTVKDYNLDINITIEKYYSFWVLFEIGKIFKSGLLNINDGRLSDEDFIRNGIKYYDLFKKGTLKIDFEEKIELSRLILMLDDIKQKKFKKHIIYKDATASGIQLLTVILGSKNNEIMSNCNLNSQDYWFDTYFYIIKLFKNTTDLKNLFKENNALIEKILNRKTLKKVTMVYSYNVSRSKGRTYFKEEVSKILVDKDNLKTNIQIINVVFNLYFNFLNDLFKGEKFFKNSLSKLLKKHNVLLKKNGSIKTQLSDQSKINLDYFKLIEYKLDRTFKKKRTRAKFCFPSDELDENKTFRALIANITHALDACYTRFILYRLDFPIITIHDCYGIDILHIDELIEAANYSINKIYYFVDIKEIHNNNSSYNSKFILL